MRLLTNPEVAAATTTPTDTTARRRRRPDSPAGRGALIAAGVLVMTVGLVGGERFESLGLGVHVLQHLLLGIAGPALIVGGARAHGRGGLLGSGGLTRRSTALLVVAYALLQPVLLVVAGSALLEAHAVLHLAVHALIVATGLAFFRALTTRHPSPIRSLATA